jgi:hypothetical protein
MKYIQCRYGIFGRKITIYTVIYGVYIYGYGQPYNPMFDACLLASSAKSGANFVPSSYTGAAVALWH